MPSQRRVLLISSVSKLSPALRSVAEEESLQVVRAPDTQGALAALKRGRFECAILDLDALGDSVSDCLSSIRGVQPQLHAMGFGQPEAAPATAKLLDLPILPKPLRRGQLEDALRRLIQAGSSPPPVLPAALLENSQAELHRRVSQLTTLYQIGRAISESRNWTEALDYFLATLRDYLDVSGAAILLYSSGNRVLAPRTVLSILDSEIEHSVQKLLAAYPVDQPFAEIHPLECYDAAAGIRCNGHRTTWRYTVLPLRYRRAPLGFLILDKTDWGETGFSEELFFLQTIQTILAEEVANAVHLSRLVDLKNFNEAVLESIESGVLTVNERGEITYVNRLARKILGLSPQPETLPKLRFDALFQVGERGDQESVFNPIVQSADGRCSFEGQLTRLDGQRVHVRLRTSRIINPSDSQLLVLAAFEDLTEQRLLEEQLRRAERLRSLGELSAAIAHEVRNPLQGLSLTLSNLKEHLKPGAEPYVEVMFSEMERLDGIVGNILSFARPPMPMPRPCALGEIANRVMELAAERASKRDVLLDLQNDLTDDRCEMDDGQIVQVLLNIVMNAIDASPAGETVAIRLRESMTSLLQVAVQSFDSKRIHIEVQDNGPGIPESNREKLFDPFFTTKSEGTGLGLSVSQKIVEEHHGTIHIESKPGKGALFIVDLPRHLDSGFVVIEPRTSQQGA